MSSHDQWDVSSLFLGDILGEGVARRVYAYRPDPEMYVVKVQNNGGNHSRFDFQNIAEWSLWQAANAKLARWLAPCYAMSPSGHALLQRRCEPCPSHLIPAKVPQVLGDLHTANFGILGGKVVVVDYGRHLALELTANATAMRSLNLDERTSTQILRKS